jgi:VanZ family protein
MLKKNIFSIIVAFIIMYLSLTSSNTFDRVSFLNFPWTDKFVHFAMYSGLMAVIILEHRDKLRSMGNLLLTALIPLTYGILMEFLQAEFTVTRSASFYDVLADLSGIATVLLIWLLIKSRVYE